MNPARLSTAAATVASDPNVSLDGWQALLVIAILGCSVVLGLLTAGLAVYRYRRQADPALRALVIGFVLVAVAPLPFRLFVSGSIAPVVRELAPSVLQTAGLLSILYAMYGDPRPRGAGLLRELTRTDLLVVTAALAMGLTTAVFGGLFDPHPVVIAIVSVVVAVGMFVAGQAARAAVRYSSVTMASLAVGIVLLVVLPTPLGALTLASGVVSEAIVLTALSACILLGEGAMFLALAYRQASE